VWDRFWGRFWLFWFFCALDSWWQTTSCVDYFAQFPYLILLGQGVLHVGQYGRLFCALLRTRGCRGVSSSRHVPTVPHNFAHIYQCVGDGTAQRGTGIRPREGGITCGAQYSYSSVRFGFTISWCGSDSNILRRIHSRHHGTDESHRTNSLRYIFHCSYCSSMIFLHF